MPALLAALELRVCDQHSIPCKNSGTYMSKYYGLLLFQKLHSFRKSHPQVKDYGLTLGTDPPSARTLQLSYPHGLKLTVSHPPIKIHIHTHSSCHD